MRIFKSRKDVLGFDDRILFLKGVPIVGVLTNLLFFGHMLKNGFYTMFSMCLIVAFVYAGGYWLVFREIHFYYVKKYPDYNETKTRLSSTFLMMAICFVVLYHLGKLIMCQLVAPQFVNFEVPHPLIEVISSIMFSLLVVTLYEAMYSTNRLRKTLVEKESLEKANINSQLMGLRSQINPHFLFNSLNTLTSLIHTDADRAENFATKLSKVYRYLLEHRDDKLTSLEEEVNWLESYIHLLKERFGENIHVVLDIPETYKSHCVLPLCLQITFENAIKHNIITSDRPLCVKVEATEDYLCITNNLQKKSVVNGSTNFGLENIKRRYNFFTNKEVRVIETVDFFKVCLPLLDASNLKEE